MITSFHECFSHKTSIFLKTKIVFTQSGLGSGTGPLLFFTGKKVLGSPSNSNKRNEHMKGVDPDHATRDLQCNVAGNP